MQVPFQEFINYLCFPICLWMVGSAHFQLSPLKFEWLLPELASKCGVSIRHDGCRHAMQFKDLFDD